MLISAVTPFMTIYHLPQGQYGYKGHVINMPQDLSVFATSLPRLPSELDVMIVRKKGSNNTHRDFRVRRMVVQRALQWLKRNNKYYRTIDIDVSVLSQLPEDGDLTDKCGVEIEDATEKQEEEELPSEDTDPADVATFIPVVARKMTEKDTIRKSVHHRQPTEDQVVPWPENGSVPIDEFKTEGYISCAFPTLFPTGEADFLAPRQQTVTLGMYFKHLMMYGEVCEAPSLPILCSQHRNALACSPDRQGLHQPAPRRCPPHARRSACSKHLRSRGVVQACIQWSIGRLPMSWPIAECVTKPLPAVDVHHLKCASVVDDQYRSGTCIHNTQKISSK